MTVTPEADPDLRALVRDVLDTAEPDGTWRVELDRTLWARMDELGLTSLLSRQGAGWVDLDVVLEGCAARGITLPIVEHDVLAGWLLSEVGVAEWPDGLLVPVAVDDYGRAAGVPWATQADHLVILSPVKRVRLVAATEVTTAESADLAGRPCGTVAVGDPGPELPAPPAAHTGLQWRHRLTRCVQITAAMGGALDLAVAYASERTQFGRPLNKFQAVQHLLADAAAEHALAMASTRAAIAHADRDGPAGSPLLERSVAIASCVAARSLGVVAGNTHQILGAMGTTLEHPLQAVLRPALAWRAELGSITALEREIADDAFGYDGSVWEWMTV